MRVAVIGTGIMGAPIARNITKSGQEVVVWNRTREKAQEIDDVQVADAPADAVDGADAVVTMLSARDAVREVMTRDVLEAFGDGVPWLQMSTIGVRATQELAELAGDAGVAMVDSPVLGTRQPAEQAKLIVLASGRATARERAARVFDAIAQKTLWLGDEPGAATRMKLVLNNWVLGLTEVLAESLALANELGVDQKQVLDVLDGNPVGSPYAQLKGKAIVERELDPSFPLRLAAKDARLVLEAAGGQVEMPATEATAEQMERAAEMGYGDRDMAATYFASAGAEAA